MDRLTHVADIGELMTLERQFDALARAAHGERHYGLVLVDLVELRTLNDRVGRPGANEVLISLATRLRELSPRGLIARVEADKFAVLIDGCDQDQITVEGHRLKNALNDMTWRVQGSVLPVRVRVTCVAGPSPFLEETNLLWDAQRIHRAKARWELKEKVKELENLARLNGVRAQLGTLQSQMAISISRRDPLTGALNRRGFDQVRTTMAPPYALAFVDVDDLKMVNRTEGQNWEAGNRALKGLKELLETISPNGVVVRWAGDEFLLCLPGFSASETAEALTALLARRDPLLLVGDRQVTFSGGIAMVRSDLEVESAMEKAQQCARDAKDAGRSRFIVAD